MDGMALKEKLETLPTQPGVYLFKDREVAVVYVGKARLLRDRVRQYCHAAPLPASVGRRQASLSHKTFGVRSCKEVLNGRGPRPCLQYQIGRCIAPCVAEICSLERYRQPCEDARLFLEGRTEEVLRRLRAAMQEAAAADRFEEAASLRDQVRTLERLETPQKVTTTDIEERD